MNCAGLAFNLGGQRLVGPQGPNASATHAIRSWRCRGLGKPLSPATRELSPGPSELQSHPDNALPGNMRHTHPLFPPSPLPGATRGPRDLLPRLGPMGVTGLTVADPWHPNRLLRAAVPAGRHNPDRSRMGFLSGT